MKRIFKEFLDFLNCMAEARAATRLTRMGEWRTAQKMYQDQK